MRGRRRLMLVAAAAAIGVLTATGLVAGQPAMATTAPAAACSGTSGVTVVVDFRALGGGVQTGCAGGDPASGLAALTGAGFSPDFASRQPGIVCRINNKPGPDAEPCVNTPPANAYWSYWHGQLGGSWAYSNLGAGSHDPAPGSVEGWAFGAGQQPGIAPPVPPAPPAPKPPPPAPPPPPGPPGAPAPVPQPPPGAPAPGAPEVPGAPPPEPGQPLPPHAESSSAPAPTDEAAPTTTPPPDSPQGTAAEAGSESGGITDLIVGIVVIATVTAVGLWTARRRTRQP